MAQSQDSQDKLKLKVAEAVQDDVNKGIVRIDSNLMYQIGVKPGSIVLIEGERKTVAIVDRAYPSDIGLNIIRMDGIVRRNSKASIGDVVKVSLAKVKEASKIIIAPAQANVQIQAPPGVFKQGLLGRACIKGDIVSIGGTKRRRTTMSDSPFFDDIFNLLDENFPSFGFSDIKFVVVDCIPGKEPVIITENTEVVYSTETVELKENAMPDITYEDVGGLNEELSKIRELVELPLKHPEIFERLGIEAPKGILMYGPPGTGKTLLAKAVANETNSNFSLINGPEIMGKFYGQSLPGDEKVLVFEKGLIKRKPIQEIVESNNKNIKIPCFDKEGKLVLGEITDLIKHKNNSKILEVETRSGRKIRVTDYHSLFTLGKKGIEDIKTSELVEGKSYIAVPAKIKVTKNKVNETDALKLLKVAKAPKYLEKAADILGKEILLQDIYWDKVISIKETENEEFVYDIGVNPSHNFIAGFGGIFAHNSEENIRKIFEDAEKNAPSIIFIDEIDAIAPKRDDSKGEVERRVVAQLLALMDGLNSRGRVIVIAATNRPNALDPALRRPGRFDREIEIGVPNKEGREAILKIHTRNMPIKPSIKKMYVENKIISLSNKIIDMELKAKSITNDDNKKQLMQNIEDDKKLLSDLRQLFDVLTGDEKSNEERLKKFVGSKKDKDNKDVNENNFKQIFVEGMIGEIASKTHGFVGADLLSLAKEAAMVVLRHIVPDLDLKKDERIPDEVLNKLIVSREDFETALRFVRPSAMREVLIEVPNVKWSDVGGLEDVKQEIKEAVEWPLKYKEAFTRLGIRPPKGVLLYGPPGTGKTLVAKAVATQSEANFISVKGPELISKWVGESEKGLREIFSKARQTAPCIIFFDEIDAIMTRRSSNDDTKVTERMVNQFLTEMDGIEEMRDVIIIGATNRPDMVDPALLRTGRFDRIILTPIPDEKARIEIFKVHTKNMPIDYKSLSKDELGEAEKASKDPKEQFMIHFAKKTEGYVGADIEGICREAAMTALRRDIGSKEITAKDFADAVTRVSPSVTEDVVELYEEFKKHFSIARSKEFKDNSPNYFG